MLIWLHMQKIIVKKILGTNIFLLKIGFLLLFFFFFGIMFDSLNAIRLLPFVSIPFLMYILLKLFIIGANSKKHNYKNNAKVPIIYNI